MTTGETEPSEKDFYAQLMVEIEAGNVNRAVEMIMALEEHRLQTEILSRLARALDHALDIRGASTLDLNRARALARARDCALDLARALDRDFERAGELSLALDRAGELSLALDRARALYLYLDRAALMNRTIIGCLNVLMDKDKSSSADIASVMESPPTARKSNRGRVISIALLCILICIAVVWVLVLRAQNGVP